MTNIAPNASVRIAWEEHGRGEPLLLIQGLGYGRWGWSPLVPLLSKEYRVITFDNRGIGDSSAPLGPYDAASMAGDAVAVLEAAGVDRSHVAGTSLGGMIAQELALRWPQRIKRLMLMCTTPGGSDAYPMPEETAEMIAAAVGWDQRTALHKFVENALSDQAPAEVFEEILKLRLANPQSPAAWASQAAAGMTYDGGGRVARIRAPTLVMHGTSDRVVDYRNSELLAALIPNAELCLFPDGGHLFFWEEPDSVAKTMIGFLA
ncbi:MAG: alpha/beta fold hydrolase [Acidimicrobiia bacterium]